MSCQWQKRRSVHYQLMEIVSRHLSDNNTNAVDMNAQMRRVLVDYRIQQTDPTQPTEIATEMLTDTPEEPKENSNSPLANVEQNFILVLLQAVNNNIKDLHSKLDSHICNTNMQFSSLTFERKIRLNVSRDVYPL